MTLGLSSAEAVSAALLRLSKQRRARQNSPERRAGVDSAVIGLAAAAAAFQVSAEASEVEAADSGAPVANSLEDLLAFGGGCVPADGEKVLDDEQHNHGAVASDDALCASPFASPFANKYARAHDDHEDHDASQLARHNGAHPVGAAGAHTGDAMTGMAHAASAQHAGNHADSGAPTHQGHRTPDQSGDHEAHASRDAGVSDHQNHQASAAPAAHAGEHGATTTAVAHDHHAAIDARITAGSTGELGEINAAIDADNDAVAALGDLAAALSGAASDPHASHGASVTLAALDLPNPAEDLSAFVQTAI